MPGRETRATRVGFLVAAIGSATGAYFDDPEAYFGAVSAGPEAIVAQVLFFSVVVGVVAFGSERATKLMVPSIAALSSAISLLEVSSPTSPTPPTSTAPRPRWVSDSVSSSSGSRRPGTRRG